MEPWIEVSKEMPLVGEYVLLLLEGETMLKGRLRSNGWSAYFLDGEKSADGREVTHWMNLPPLPGTEQQQQPKMSREEIAAMALQGLISNPVYNNPDDPRKLPTVTNFAIAARFYADALLLELSKP